MDEDRVPRGRNESIEALRIVATFSIVLFHSGAPGHDVAYSGLIIFLILSPYFECLNWARTRSVRHLARVFLLPWLAWMLIYGALDIVRGVPVLPGDNYFLGVLTGTATHLWFMPAMFAALLFIGWMKRKFSQTLLFIGSGALAAAILTTAHLWRPVTASWPSPLGQWAHASAAVCLGISLGLAAKVQRRIVFAVGGILALVLCILVAENLSGMSIPYVVGVIITALVAWFGPARIPAGRAIGQIASCMLGVYLSQGVFLMFADRIVGYGNWLTAVVAFGASLATVCAFRTWSPALRETIRERSGIAETIRTAP